MCIERLFGMVVCLIATASVLGVVRSAYASGENIVIDAGPEHPWNRLAEELFTCVTMDGHPHYGDGLGATFKTRKRFFGDDESHQTALANALDVFEQAGGCDLEHDPLPRALLQRDLWAMFCAIAMGPKLIDLDVPLGSIMKDLALTEDEIAQLPDNLEQTVKSRAFPHAFDGARPDSPFLPPDLVDKDGPWVLLVNLRPQEPRPRSQGNFGSSASASHPNSWNASYERRFEKLAAPAHSNDADGRSAFFVYLNLPGGRVATIDYLDEVKEAIHAKKHVPQFPIGTQVALQRRTILIGNDGNLHLSPLTESLQLRVYDRIDVPRNFEFGLNRKAVLDIQPVSLRPRVLEILNAEEMDRFFSTSIPGPLITDPGLAVSCVVCHAGAGIEGFQSVFSHFVSPLGPTNIEDQAAAAIGFAYQTHEWNLLATIWHADQH